MSRIVCRCSDVREDEVKKFYSLYPKMPMDQMKQALRIGIGCRCCQVKDCPIIDVRYEEIIDDLTRVK